MKFIHRLDRRVTLSESGETGIVVGRAHYSNSENHYLVRYKAADGRQVESWWGESGIANPPAKKKAVKK